MTNQEIILAIFEHSPNSYVSTTTNCIRFCLDIEQDKKETVKNGLSETGLNESHLRKLMKAGIIHEYHVDDCTLHILIKESFLSDEQKAQARENLAAHLESEAAWNMQEAERLHANKCVAMHKELVDAIKMALWAEGNGEAEAQRQGKPRLSERCDIFRKLIEQAEQK
jgi:hypothetical protein